jgi:uncharacterized Zn finger protein
VKEMQRNITIRCTVCGNDQFSAIDSDTGYDDLSDAPDDIKVRCSDCGNEFTKAELVEGNQETIAANIELLKKDVMMELKKNFPKLLK